VGDRELPAARRDRRGARPDAALCRTDDRDRHPPRAEDGRAAPDVAARRRDGRRDREPQHDPAVRNRLSVRARRAGDRRADQRPGRARQLPLGARAHASAAVARQRRRPLRPLPRRAVRRLARRDGGDDLGPHAPRTAARPHRAAGARDQRQSDQAVRREPSRGRSKRARVVHAHHEQVHGRQARDRVRLWRTS
jgi:hypothetical protein